MRLSRLAAASLLTVTGIGFWAGTASAVPLVQHRAVYDLKLSDADERSGITGINGRMVYEIRGSACEGYTVRFRYVTESTTTEASQITDQQTTTFEDADGKSFSFATKSYANQELTKELRGNATREPDGVNIQIDKPDTKKFELKQTQFPTQHLVDLIQRAKSGETFYETSIFDGSEDADRAMTTTVIVGKQATSNSADPEFETLQALGSQKYWPVDIAYFDEQTDGGEDTPEYRISFKLYENGLTRDLQMDYGDFAIHGQLVDLAVFEPDDKSTCTR